MNCPYCNKECIVGGTNSLSCFDDLDGVDNGSHYFRITDKGYFRLWVSNIRIGHSITGFYIEINNKQTDIDPFKVEDAYVLLQRYKNLMLFS